MAKKKDERAEAEQSLKDSFDKWEHLYRYGGSDPFWTDGVNMELVRKHIINSKRKCRELDFFPEIYYRETPPEVPRDYMARAQEIRENAKRSLGTYKADRNFLWLVKNKPNGKTAKDVHYDNVLGYVHCLEDAIQKDDLIAMRRHSDPKTYKESFRRCREKIEEEMNKDNAGRLGQMDIFDFPEMLP